MIGLEPTFLGFVVKCYNEYATTDAHKGIQFIYHLAWLLTEQRASKNVNNCLNANIYSFLETLGGQSSNLF